MQDIAQMKMEAEERIEEILAELKIEGFPVFKVQIYGAGERVNLVRYEGRES